MASVKVKLRRSTVKGKAGFLYIQLIHLRRIKLITTRFRLFPSEWDARTARVQVDLNDSKNISRLLNVKQGLEMELQVIESTLEFLDNRGEFTVDEWGEYYLNHSFTGVLFPYMKQKIKELVLLGQLKTASTYEDTFRSFSAFRLGQDIRIDDITPSLLRKYENHLKSKGLRMNTISFYMRVLRSVYNKAVDDGLCVQIHPFRQVYTGVDKTVKRAIDESLLVRLKAADLSDKPVLALARDMFLFSFYTRGMSFVDMAYLRKKDVKENQIEYVRRKTGQLLHVKIEPCIREIIQRYDSLVVDSEFLLPLLILSKKKANENLYLSALRLHNKRLKTLSVLLDLPISISSYVARHTWATIAKRKGITLQLISEGMGHETESTTRIYLASLDQSQIDTANKRIISIP